MALGKISSELLETLMINPLTITWERLKEYLKTEFTPARTYMIKSDFEDMFYKGEEHPAIFLSYLIPKATYLREAEMILGSESPTSLTDMLQQYALSNIKPEYRKILIQAMNESVDDFIDEMCKIYESSGRTIFRTTS